MMDPEPAYYVEAEPDKDTFLVRDGNARTILSCRDEMSAEHYVVLLNEAFRRGYKQGYRDARAK